MSRMEKLSETVTSKARELHVECDEYLHWKPNGKVMRHAIDIVAPFFFRISRFFAQRFATNVPGIRLGEIAGQ